MDRRLSRDPRLPRWLQLRVEGCPLPQNGPLSGVRVQMELDLPANQILFMDIPVITGPTGQVGDAIV